MNIIAPPKNSGHLYVFEGPNGVGKTTLANTLVERFSVKGVPCIYASFPGREKGSLGNLVYNWHHAPNTHYMAVDPTSIQLLHIAAHIDAIQRLIRPSLAEGCHVVLDRFWWSTLIYGRQSGAHNESLKRMFEIEQMHWEGITPTTLFLVHRDKPLDEPLSRSWHELSAAYGELGKQQAKNYPVIEVCNQASLDSTMKLVLHNIEILLGEEL